MRHERRKVTTVLEQHEKLLDVLEIPQLIDTCVKNGYYQEALDLANHTQTLVKRFPDIPIVRSVEVEVAGSISQMHTQLLQLLQEPAKLPSLFKAVNFLRRMAILGEEELALAFLASRGAYMKGLFESIERERTMDVSRFLKKWIDLWREGVYDVVTQFTSIFLERPPPTSHSTLAPDLRPFLTIFTHTLVRQLLNILSLNIPQITDSPALSSLLTQLSYCSSSFSRIGLDFKALFPPIFESAVKNNFRTSVESACSAFRASLEKAQGTRRGTAVKPPSSWLILADAIPDPPLIPLSSVSSTFIPSTTLSTYPPLALLANKLLSALNSLRLLAPTSIFPQLLAILDDALSSTSASLLSYSQQALNRHRKSFDMGDSVEASEREKSILFGVTRAWFYLVGFVRHGLVEGVYARASTDRTRVTWDEWDEWLQTLGKEDFLGLPRVLVEQEEIESVVPANEAKIDDNRPNGMNGTDTHPSASSESSGRPSTDLPNVQ